LQVAISLRHASANVAGVIVPRSRPIVQKPEDYDGGIGRGLADDAIMQCVNFRRGNAAEGSVFQRSQMSAKVTRVDFLAPGAEASGLQVQGGGLLQRAHVRLRLRVAAAAHGYQQRPRLFARFAQAQFGDARDSHSTRSAVRRKVALHDKSFHGRAAGHQHSEAGQVSIPVNCLLPVRCWCGQPCDGTFCQLDARHAAPQ
jgi:hypothetical protein